MTTKKKKTSKPPYSLVSPQAMGGIHGGDGYSYQDRYIVCNIPKWISDPSFIRLMSEGTGDVDVVFINKRKHFSHSLSHMKCQIYFRSLGWMIN